ncbi:Putative ribonuclease H protein [Arachis hypogaea]|nr:Putative ribonuclease H protein [Arachis hypogaea]
MREIDEARNPTSQNRPNNYREISWKVLSNGWTKLNADGALRGNYGPANRVRVLINDIDGWIYGFTNKMNHTTTPEVEVQTIMDGMKLAWGRGISKLIMESDSKVVSELIQNPRLNQISSLGC